MVLDLLLRERITLAKSAKGADRGKLRKPRVDRALRNRRSEPTGDVVLRVGYRSAEVVGGHRLEDRGRRILSPGEWRGREVRFAGSTIQPLNFSDARSSATGLEAGLAAVRANKLGDR